MMPSSPTTFRLLLMVTLAIWAQADGEDNTCAENGGTCVAEDDNSCAHEADYPGCGENEMCCVSSGRFVKRQTDNRNSISPEACKKEYNGNCLEECPINQIHTGNCSSGNPKCCGCKIKSACTAKPGGICIEKGHECHGKLKPEWCIGKNCTCCIPDCPQTEPCYDAGGRCDKAENCNGDKEPNYNIKCINKDCVCCVKKTSCEFNGTYYYPGDTIPGICIDMTCSVNYNWVTNHTFNPNCSVCNVYNDLHFKTFDDHRYDFHGLCNYSISQLEYGKNETFGIYGQFRECWDGIWGPSCLNITTFKDDPNTVINILYNAGPNVGVNGNPYTLMPEPERIVAGYWPKSGGPVCHPVIAWRSEGWTPYENCNFFLGTQGYLLATCGVQLFVWACPTCKGFINGLCGHYDDDQDNDFVARNTVIYSEATPAFALSWQTADQPEPYCPQRDDDVSDDVYDDVSDDVYVDVSDDVYDDVSDKINELMP